MSYYEMFEILKGLGARQYSSYISASQYLRAFNLVEKYASNLNTVLDWGAGEGHFTYFLLEKGYTVTSFTILDDCLLSDHMEKKYLNKYKHVCDSNSTINFPFGDNSFDFVVSIGVLEHVRETGGNELSSLREIKRVLKPNGVFMCYHFPNKYSWIEFLNKYIKSKYSHMNKYSKKEIKYLVSRVGFQLLESKRYNLFPRLMFKNTPNNIYLTRLFNTLDNIASILFSPICQNHYFMVKKISG